MAIEDIIKNLDSQSYFFMSIYKINIKDDYDSDDYDDENVESLIKQEINIKKDIIFWQQEEEYEKRRKDKIYSQLIYKD